MEYRVLPKSDMNISAIGIGSGSIHQSNEKQTIEIIDYAQEHGVNLIDMATSYPQPWEYYGVALKGRRKQFYTQMHLGITFESGAYARDYSLESVKRSFENQLNKIGTYYTDIALFHCVDTANDYNIIMDGGVFEYAVGLKKAGVIKNLGFASHTVDTSRKFIETGEIEVFMFSVNPAYDFDPAALDPYGEDTKIKDSLTVANDRQRLYYDCAKGGISIHAMKAYGGGKLLADNTSPFGKALTIPQCIQYALDRPAVNSCLLGIRNKGDLEDALKLYHLPKESLDYSFIAELQPKELRGSCVYCNHCMPCPSGIDIAMTHKFLDLYLAGDALALEHYRGMDKNAKGCVECGVCETRCPFGVPVRDKMKKAVEAMAV